MTEMTAAGRAVLEYLAARHKQAIEAKKIADWLGKTLPKTQAALTDLKARGFVRHFAETGGHAGTWAVTPTGYDEVDGRHASPDRYQMALEAISLVSQLEAHKIAERALKP